MAVAAAVAAFVAANPSSAAAAAVACWQLVRLLPLLPYSCGSVRGGGGVSVSRTRRKEGKRKEKIGRKEEKTGELPD